MKTIISLVVMTTILFSANQYDMSAVQDQYLDKAKLEKIVLQLDEIVGKPIKAGDKIYIPSKDAPDGFFFEKLYNPESINDNILYASNYLSEKGSIATRFLDKYKNVNAARIDYGTTNKSFEYIRIFIQGDFDKYSMPIFNSFTSNLKYVGWESVNDTEGKWQGVNFDKYISENGNYIFIQRNAYPKANNSVSQIMVTTPEYLKWMVTYVLELHKNKKGR